MGAGRARRQKVRTGIRVVAARRAGCGRVSPVGTRVGAYAGRRLVLRFGEFPVAKSRSKTVLDVTVWPTGVTKGQWQWRAFKTELVLPAGPVVLTLHAREDGTKIDRLFLAADLSQEPEE